MRPEFRRAYQYDRRGCSQQAAVRIDSRDRTQQQFRDEADINVLVRRFGVTGHLPVRQGVPEYGDFSAVVDYHSAMNAIRNADAEFMSLPAHIRQMFGNDPGELVNAVLDPDRYDDLVDAGLAVKRNRPVEASEPSGKGESTPPAVDGDSAASSKE